MLNLLPIFYPKIDYNEIEIKPEKTHLKRLGSLNMLYNSN